MTVQPHPQPLPRALLEAEFVFVRDDASKPPLSLLYRGPYRVLKRSETFFFLQIGEKADSVSVDRLKPVVSSIPVIPSVTLFGVDHGWNQPPFLDLQFQVVLRWKKVSFSPVKKVRFSLVPATQLRRNPHWTVWGSPPLSAVLHPHILGGVTVATTKTTFGTSNVPASTCKPRYLRGRALVC